MPSRLPFVPLDQQCEWIGSRYTFPDKVRDGDSVIQPQVIIWLELPRGVLLATTLINPRNPVSFAETLEETLRNPAEGLPRRPARIRVPDERLAKELRKSAGGIPIIVAPVPEVDAVFAELTEATAGQEPTPTYLGDGDIQPAVVKDFFSAAVLLFRAAPWRHVQEYQVLRVDIPRFDIADACLSVIGSFRESEGILLFRSIADYLVFGSTVIKPNRTGTGGIAMRSLSFDRKKIMPPSMVREIEQHRWPIAGPKGYPALICVDAEMSLVVPEEHDYRIMTACAQAFVAFFARHRRIFATDAPDQICESLTSDDDVTVTLTAPDFTEELTDVANFEGDELDDDSIEMAPPPAGNDPCPCGSGKKYKKCHLVS